MISVRVINTEDIRSSSSLPQVFHSTSRETFNPGGSIHREDVVRPKRSSMSWLVI